MPNATLRALLAGVFGAEIGFYAGALGRGQSAVVDQQCRDVHGDVACVVDIGANHELGQNGVVGAADPSCVRLVLEYLLG